MVNGDCLGDDADCTHHLLVSRRQYKATHIAVPEPLGDDLDQVFIAE